jgi:hypothetical protein
MNDTIDGIDDGQAGEIDPEVALIIDYLSGSMAPAEAERFEERLVEDEALFNKAAPIMRLWDHPATIAASARLATSDSGVVPIDRKARAVGTLRGVTKASVLLAASLAIAALGISALVRSEVFTIANIRRIGAAMGIIEKTPVQQRLPSMEKTTAPQDSSLRVRLPGDDVTVVLRPNAVLMRMENPAVTALALPDTKVWLTGEAVFDVRARPLQVVTDAGTVTLMRGRFAVRCDHPCTEVQLSVQWGLAWFRGSDGKRVLITPGEYGRMTAAGAEKTDGAGYPVVPVLADSTRSDSTSK